MKPIKPGSKADKMRKQKSKLKEIYGELYALEKDNKY